MTRSWTWHLVRASGVVLAVGMPLLFVRWAFTPDLGRASVATVDARWASAPWRVLEWLVCALALTHAVAAIDRRLATGPRAVRAVVVAGMAAVSALGLVVLARSMAGVP